METGRSRPLGEAGTRRQNISGEAPDGVEPEPLASATPNMIYAPGVTNADIGVNADALKKHPSLPFVYAGYSGGTRTAYIIVKATEDKGHAH